MFNIKMMQSIVLNSIQSMVVAQKTKQARWGGGGGGLGFHAHPPPPPPPPPPPHLVSLPTSLRKLLTFHDTTTLEVIMSEEQAQKFHADVSQLGSDWLKLISLAA